jgi:hypothetical protein
MPWVIIRDRQSSPCAEGPEPVAIGRRAADRAMEGRGPGQAREHGPNADEGGYTDHQSAVTSGAEDSSRLTSNEEGASRAKQRPGYASRRDGYGRP